MLVVFWNTTLRWFITVGRTWASSTLLIQYQGTEIRNHALQRGAEIKNQKKQGLSLLLYTNVMRQQFNQAIGPNKITQAENLQLFSSQGGHCALYSYKDGLHFTLKWSLPFVSISYAWPLRLAWCKLDFHVSSFYCLWAARLVCHGP